MPAVLDGAVAPAGTDPRDRHALPAPGMPERTIALARVPGNVADGCRPEPGP